LRVVSFNIRNGLACDGLDSWPFRRNLVAQTLRRLDGDLLALQKVYLFQQRHLLDRLPGYGVVGEGRSWKGRFGERCPIFFRRDRLRLLDWRSHRLPRSSPPRIATSALFGPVEGAGNQPPEVPPATFQVFNLHLDHRSPETRQAQAAAVLGFAQPLVPALILGDLNETPTGPALRLLLKTELNDALAGFPAKGARAATYHGFTGTLDGQRIDHILTSPHWEVERAEVVRRPRVSSAGTSGSFPPGSFPSDHWPILADLRLNAGHNPART